MRAQTDRRMDDALRSAVRRSLAELARLLAGDKRAEVAPLFTVALALERTNRIELRPTVQARPARRCRQRQPLRVHGPARRLHVRARPSRRTSLRPAPDVPACPNPNLSCGAARSTSTWCTRPARTSSR